MPDAIAQFSGVFLNEIADCGTNIAIFQVYILWTQ